MGKPKPASLPRVEVWPVDVDMSLHGAPKARANLEEAMGIVHKEVVSITGHRTVLLGLLAICWGGESELLPR